MLTKKIQDMKNAPKGRKLNSWGMDSPLSFTL